jgi:ABC-2 type transport system ATP-binding protein
MINNNALEVQNLYKTYDGFTLNDVSFTLPVGYIMGFIGKNGAGKTTTIRCILNMAARDSGDIKILGLDNIQDEMEAKEQLGTIFDSNFFVGAWRVRDVEKAIKGFYSKWDSKLFNDYLKKFHLPLKQRVKKLSRGMMTKLMLAASMSHGAKLLILDEPTSGLDPVARDELNYILQKYIEDGTKSVFFSTHITSDLEQIADYITLIDNGRIFYTGTKDGLLEEYCIVKGGLNDLNEELKQKIIGLVIASTGFTGLMRVSDIKGLSENIVTESSTIDQILIHISKMGGNDYE